LKERGVAPKELLADSLYGSNSNCKKAKREHGVEAIAPLLLGGQKYFHLSKFSLNEQGRITSCPAVSHQNRLQKPERALARHFHRKPAFNAKNFDIYPVKKGTKACYYRYKEKDINTAFRRRYEESAAFKDKYRYRAEVAATMSEYDRRTGVKHL